MALIQSTKSICPTPSKDIEEVLTRREKKCPSIPRKASGIAVAIGENLIDLIMSKLLWLNEAGKTLLERLFIEFPHLAVGCKIKTAGNGFHPILYCKCSHSSPFQGSHVGKHSLDLNFSPQWCAACYGITIHHLIGILVWLNALPSPPCARSSRVRDSDSGWKL